MKLYCALGKKRPPIGPTSCDFVASGAPGTGISLDLDPQYPANLEIPQRSNIAPQRTIGEIVDLSTTALRRRINPPGKQASSEDLDARGPQQEGLGVPIIASLRGEAVCSMRRSQTVERTNRVLLRRDQTENRPERRAYGSLQPDVGRGFRQLCHPGSSNPEYESVRHSKREQPPNGERRCDKGFQHSARP